MLIKKIAVFFLLVIFGFLLIYFAEKILNFKNLKELGYVESRGQGARYILLKEHQPLIRMTVEPFGDYFKNSDSLVQKKYKFRTDQNGFIIPSKIYDHPDMTIVFLGGSTTECLYMEEEDRFPYLAGRMLEKETGKKINSYNSGVSGNNSLHSLDILLNKVIPMKPDVVIMQHNINDLVILMLCDTYWNSRPGVAPINSFAVAWYEPLKQVARRFIPNLCGRARAFQNKFLYETMMDAFKDVRGTKKNIDKNKIENEFRMNLQTFINICAARKIIPVLMTQQNRLNDSSKVIRDAAKALKLDYDIEYEDFKRMYNLLNETVRKVGKENNVLVIDLAEEIPQERGYIYDMVHLNDSGSRLAAQIISHELKKITVAAGRESK